MGLVFYERGFTEILSSFHHVRTQLEACDLEEGSLPTVLHLISDFQPPDLCEIKFCL